MHDLWPWAFFIVASMLYALGNILLFAGIALVIYAACKEHRTSEDPPSWILISTVLCGLCIVLALSLMGTQESVTTMWNMLRGAS